MSSGSSRTFVYVANAGSRELLVFNMHPESGELTLLEHVLGGKFTTIAITPDRKWLFAGLRDEPFGIASFAVDPKRGTLKPLDETRVPGPLAFIGTDHSGRWLLGASYHHDFVCVCEIGADGSVREPHQIVGEVSKAHSVVAAPGNDFVVAAALGADALVRWPFDATQGRLNEAAVSYTKVTAGAGPRHVRFDPRAKRLYVLCELDASLRTFEYSEDGSLTERALAAAVPKGFRGKRWAAELRVTPNGRFLYASERTSSTLAAFAIDAAGRLEPLGTVPTQRQPRAFALDPSGRFLFAVGQLSNRLSSYGIDSEVGVLTKLGEHPVGIDPVWVEAVSID